MVEGIIYELNVDEQAKGYANLEEPGPGSKTSDIRDANLMHPQLRQSMANITEAYIVDVNGNISGGQAVMEGSIKVNPDHLIRFLADLGKDEAAHQTVATAEQVWAAAKNEQILSGRFNPDNNSTENLDSMMNTSREYGRVLGALDFGAAEALHADRAQQNTEQNKIVENQFMVASLLAEGTVGALTSPVPGGSDVANGFVGIVLENLEEAQKGDNHAHATYDASTIIGSGRATAGALVEASLYQSGNLENLPEQLIQADGQPKPMREWSNDDIDAWDYYTAVKGNGTAGKPAGDAEDYYTTGYSTTKNFLTDWKNGGTK